MSDDDVFEPLAQIAAALSSPTRLKALQLLFQGPRSIDALAELLGESEANTAAHMKALRSAGLVRPERRGKYMFQEVSDDSVLRLFLALREAGEQLSPAVRLMDEHEEKHASPMTPEELSGVLGERRLVLIDLRSEEEYARGHLPFARSIPYEALAKRIDELPARRRIFAYCRHKYCPTARHGVDALRKAGLRAERLRFGVPEWRASGLALEVTS